MRIRRAPYPYEGYYIVKRYNGGYLTTIFDNGGNIEYSEYFDSHSEACEEVAMYYGYWFKKRCAIGNTGRNGV